MGMVSCLIKTNETELKSLLEDPGKLTDKLYGEDSKANKCDLDKAWHAIHFLLNGSVWGVTSPAGALLLGGEPVSEEDVGYGPARYFTVEQVREASDVLDQLEEEGFFSNYSSMLEQRDGICPAFEDTKEDREYIGSYFETLRGFCATAARDKQCIISYLE